MTAKPRTSENPTSNTILERIHRVLENLVRTFNITQTHFDKDDPWLVILAAEESAIPSTTNRFKNYSQGQLVFGRDKILLIKYKVDWELIHQRD